MTTMTTLTATAIKRSGPPTTYDSVMWRVPLSAPPSRTWEQAFRAASESTAIATASGVQFERTGLTFRSGDAHVPEWIEYIDRWIAHANRAQADLDEGHRRQAKEIQHQSDARRQKASEANEKFKHL